MEVPVVEKMNMMEPVKNRDARGVSVLKGQIPKMDIGEPEAVYLISNFFPPCI